MNINKRIENRSEKMPNKALSVVQTGETWHLVEISFDYDKNEVGLIKTLKSGEQFQMYEDFKITASNYDFV
jgi:hypothetical protein